MIEQKLEQIAQRLDVFVEHFKKLSQSHDEALNKNALLDEQLTISQHCCREKDILQSEKQSNALVEIECLRPAMEKLKTENQELIEENQRIAVWQKESSEKLVLITDELKTMVSEKMILQEEINYLSCQKETLEQELWSAKEQIQIYKVESDQYRQSADETRRMFVEKEKENQEKFHKVTIKVSEILGKLENAS